MRETSSFSTPSDSCKLGCAEAFTCLIPQRHGPQCSVQYTVSLHYSVASQFVLTYTLRCLLLDAYVCNADPGRSNGQADPMAKWHYHSPMVLRSMPLWVQPDARSVSLVLLKCARGREERLYNTSDVHIMSSDLMLYWR